MKSKNYYFFEPYVYVEIKKDKSLVYNSLDSKHLIIKDKETQNLIKKLVSKKNLYVVEIPKNPCTNIKSFIEHSRKLNIGDIIQDSKSDIKPIQYMPLLNIQNDIKRVDDKYGHNCLQYLSEITFFLNSNNNSKYYSQNSCCGDDCSVNKELPFDLVNKLLSLKGVKFNLSGSNVLSYSKINDLLDTIKKTSNTTVCFNYLNENLNKSKIILLKNNVSDINLTITEKFNYERVRHLQKMFNKHNLKCNYTFLVESVEAVNYSLNFINQYLLDNNWELKPLFNGENIVFFEKHIFLCLDDIISSKPTLNDIFTRQLINQLSFGKLFVSSSGNVFSNLFLKRLGNLGDVGVFDLIFKELYKQKNWFKVRKNVTPCKSCIYNALCPPISNYEYAIGKYNLCHVWKD